MPTGLSGAEMLLIDQMVSTRVKLKRGELLYQTGRPFKSLYAVRTGWFKTTVSLGDGREQVSGFYMGGELLGLDGIAQDQHTCTARALEDSEVCVLHVQTINALSRDVHALQHHVQKLMSREIVHDHNHLFLLGNMRAESRVASFLLNLLTRLHRRGQSAAELSLRMTREEIGSYLSLTLETVSRMMSKMARDGILAVDQRQVRVLRPDLLHQLAEHDASAHCQQPILPSHLAQAH
jgi:CRP/FNR family transcriptional regulator, anaerobic regulatory protein